MPRKPPKPPHVALIIETSKMYGREILRGISSYVRLHGPWSIYASERGQDDPDPPWLAKWRGNGIITRSLDLAWCRAAKRRGIPVVSLRHLLDKPDFPTIFPDQEKIVSRIVAHFRERGFQNFGYIGVDGNKGWERLRHEAFVRLVEERSPSNISIRPNLVKPGLGWEEEEEQLAAWVRMLPKPIGIMVNHDTQGIQLLDACRRAGTRVPDDVAVVSVDNDPVLCEIAAVPLSSLDQHVQSVGFRAAELLDRMMRGKKVAPKNHFTEPGEVVVRQSSDSVAVNDENLGKAIRFVRENACKIAGVEDVARASGLSRRALEKKFAEKLGRSPLEEIHLGRFRRMKQLLLETDYTLPRIAELTGFQYQEYLIRFFRKRSGMTPGAFRRKTRFKA
ncbi:MAG: DNA-binding transcriptional regulator [Terrimicrobiaceae bacterium]|nr:DNA-binding transcriptional regulator [Terrimicrobiaceae bacterium]